MGKLKCITCGGDKGKHLFYKNRECVSGYEGECKICWRKRSQARYHTMDKVLKQRMNRRAGMLQKYGITVAQYEQIHKEQNGNCSICGKPEMTKYKDGFIQRLSVDHCHSSETVRGLLCRKCNTALSAFDDDIDILASAISYLINSKVRMVS